MDYNNSSFSYLDYEYYKYSRYINNSQTHINNLHKNNIITIDIRNKLLGELSKILASLESLYKISEDDIPLKHISISEISIAHLQIDSMNTNISKFNEIGNMIVNNIAKQVGFLNIDDGVNLLLELYNYNYSLLRRIKYNFPIDVMLFSDIFVPLKYKVDIIYDKEFKHTFSKSSDQNYICDVINYNIQYNGIKIIFTGYIKNDSLNLFVKGSKVFNKSLQLKIAEIYNTSLLPREFVENYIGASNIANLLCLTVAEYNNLLKVEYEKFNNLRRIKFVDVLQEFIKDVSTDNGHRNIKNMISILNLLLLGNTENIKVANLLFDIIKESKNKFNIDIDNIIYNSMSYVNQLKLKKIPEKTNITLNVEDIDYKKLVTISSIIPDNVKKFTLDKIKEMKYSNNDYHKQHLYVKTVLNYPWPSKNYDVYGTITDKVLFLNTMKDKLNSIVYGHNDTKQAIMENVGRWIVNPSSAGNALGFVGPPGTGKTLIAKALGNAMGIPIAQITLGGQNDGDILHGHSYTYMSAQPGIIIKKMVEVGTPRCIIFFDELDKSCNKNGSNEVQNILIHLTDPNTNKDFQDRFFQEFTFPLNQVLFIFSYNNPELVNKILLDRITQVKIKPYLMYDKIQIAKKFLIDEIRNSVLLDKERVEFTDSAIQFIIENYTNEDGTRELKRHIEKIILKINLDTIYGLKDKIIVDPTSVVKYLGPVISDNICNHMYC